MLYADYEYYSQKYNGTMPEEEAVKAIKKACRHIDTLTYNRIVGRGFDKLTEFQQDIIKECACMMADFEQENEAMKKAWALFEQTGKISYYMLYHDLMRRN